jgi:hypothetical protein
MKKKFAKKEGGQPKWLSPNGFRSGSFRAATDFCCQAIPGLQFLVFLNSA